MLKANDPVIRRINLFAASREREVAVEREEWKHGAFTLAIMEGLRGKAHEDGNKDSAVLTDELGAWVVKRVRDLTGGNQNPLYYPLADAKPFRLAVFK